jgi:hypothetical protein
MLDNFSPVLVKDPILPFLSERFNDRDFEELCADLFQQEIGTRFFNYGRKGDAQCGIDLISEGTPGSYRHAIQCKRVGEFRPSDLRREVDKLRDLPFHIDCLYFAVACNVSPEVRNECKRQENVACTSFGPIRSIELWDLPFLSRTIRKYPNLVGSYFGLQWRDHFFPELSQADIQRNLIEIVAAVQEVKERLCLDIPQRDGSLRPISGGTQLSKGLEGYFKTDENMICFHGDGTSRTGFSFKYSVGVGPASVDGSRPMFSLTISPDDAVDLEAVLIMDQREPASVSTYYSHDIFLTHISGPCPIVSLPSVGFSFMLCCPEEYDKLAVMVDEYLDTFKDSALAARRERTLRFIAGGVPKTGSLLVGFQYQS